MNYKTYLKELLLEKDNRPKILKMGLSQEVADYLHNIHNKYSIWFADKLRNMPAFMSSRNQLQYIHNMQTAITGILDWAKNEPNIQINNYSWDQALQAQKEYHDSLQVSDLNFENNKIIQKYDDGFYWVDLESCSDSSEGTKMGHCASTGKGETLFSLRAYNRATKAIEPFITISASPEKGEWHQCKGKRNSKPKKEYHPYIVDILIRNDIFKFVPEFNSKSDFGSQEFIEYVEENSESIPNADEIIEKIKESSISYKDFEKIIKNYKQYFTYYNIELEENYDDNSSITTTYSFYLKINKQYTDFPVDCLNLENKKAKKYFEDVVNADFIDISVEESEEDVSIHGSIEDSDDLYTLDEDGLDSFKRQCEYYKQKNISFDKAEFIEDHLHKILVLDECIEHDLNDFVEKIKEESAGFYETKQHPKTLDVEIVSGGIKTNINKNDYISNSLLRRTSYDNIVFQSPTELINQPGYREAIHTDLLLYTIFWNFIKINVLHISSDTYKLVFNNSYKEFKFKFFYEWENQKYNFEKEYKTLLLIRDKFQDIAEHLHKFETEVIIPFIKNKKPLDIDSYNTNKHRDSYDGRKTEMSVYDAENRYVGLIEVNKNAEDHEKAVKNAIEQLVKDEGITGNYELLKTDKVRQWLSDNISHQMSFKGFFEQYYKKF